MVSVETMPTIKEREFLMPSASPKHTGFTPRPTEKLANKKMPRSMLNIECNHRLRSSLENSTYGHPSIEYRLFVEAGKHQAPYPERPDPNYNSNVWRNFRLHYGFHTTTEGRKTSEMIAAMYPLNIPPPSKVGKYTFGKFLQETPVIKDPKKRALAIRRTNNELADFRNMKAKSESRYPPIDELGNILPPEHFKRYEQSFHPMPDLTQPPPENLEGKRIDIFGRYVKDSPRMSSFRWKFSYRQNHPDYDKMMEEYEKRKNAPPRKVPFTTPLFHPDTTGP
ncbi:testis-expressed protein 52 [Lingula anatina]|uniref:Testis-expressed protein 52 n=1 Tax=Lingula anatina TaxID=7574 RepID=A0A1S3HFV7_LINAN|nr:testis-expressed protein 52 [Lingula anatina]|eukprot:XP_013384937.1 testis-expressed protein 52 [Lingula anatina]